MGILKGIISDLGDMVVSLANVIYPAEKISREMEYRDWFVNLKPLTRAEFNSHRGKEKESEVKCPVCGLFYIFYPEKAGDGAGRQATCSICFDKLEEKP